MQHILDLNSYILNFTLAEKQNLFSDDNSKTAKETLRINGKNYPKFINEFWTAKQRKASSLQEVSYRACFKPQLPKFFIKLLTKDGDYVYDPFSGRGTTVIEAGLLGRNVIANDVNPLSEIFSHPRFFIPDLNKLQQRLDNILINYQAKADIDLSMFYYPRTEAEIVSLQKYLDNKKRTGREDKLDKWIRMVATNRLTGHSKGFFSVYTLPPNQAVSPERQIKINQQRQQRPDYRNVKEIILKKSKQLLGNITDEQKKNLEKAGNKSLFLCKDAGQTDEIRNDSVQLTVTSPPFLDVVQYAKDNWLRCWFNLIDADEVEKKITMAKTISEWAGVMEKVFSQLYRITKKNGWVAFEVGEVKKGQINLDEYVVSVGEEIGFKCTGILINQQTFTKTANIWGIKNNQQGTNTNRIVIFCKETI